MRARSVRKQCRNLTDADTHPLFFLLFVKNLLSLRSSLVRLCGFLFLFRLLSSLNCSIACNRVFVSCFSYRWPTITQRSKILRFKCSRSYVYLYIVISGFWYRYVCAYVVVIFLLLFSLTLKTAAFVIHSNFCSLLQHNRLHGLPLQYKLWKYAHTLSKFETK